MNSNPLTPSEKPILSTLQLTFNPEDTEPYVEFHVDGSDFGKRVKSAFGPAGFDDALPWPGGDYTPADTVLGERVLQHGSKGAILFACCCGYVACSGVSAEVTVTSDTVTLSNLTTWFERQWHVAPIEPVTFARQQYEQAVRDLRQRIERWRHTTPSP